VRDIVFSSDDRNIIVVSAPGKRFEEDNKVTDLLVEFYNLQKELNRDDITEDEIEV
jgi:aspartokinase